MGWEDRGSCGPYYYRSVREGDRVRKVYQGGRVVGKLAAQLDEMRRQQREEEAARWREDRERLEQSTAFLRELEEAAEVLARAILVARGYRKHKGEWRMARD